MPVNVEEIKNIIHDKDIIKLDEYKKRLKSFFQKNITKNNINEYIGDFPTIIEPVVLGNNVTIGDDVLLGPNVFIGDNCVIGDYNEISNSVILNNVKMGEIFKLDFCIIEKGSKFGFEALNCKNCIISGIVQKKEELERNCVQF